MIDATFESVILTLVVVAACGAVPLYMFLVWREESDEARAEGESARTDDAPGP